APLTIGALAPAAGPTPQMPSESTLQSLESPQHTPPKENPEEDIPPLRAQYRESSRRRETTANPIPLLLQFSIVLLPGGVASELSPVPLASPRHLPTRHQAHPEQAAASQSQSRPGA